MFSERTEAKRPSAGLPVPLDVIYELQRQKKTRTGVKQGLGFLRLTLFIRRLDLEQDVEDVEQDAKAVDRDDLSRQVRLAAGSSPCAGSFSPGGGVCVL